MPYIKQEDREIVDQILVPFLTSLTSHERFVNEVPVGWYNYIISRIVHQFLIVHGLKYDNINAMIGVLECAKLELYRIIASPYEDTKILENGYISCLDSKISKSENINVMDDDKEDE
jgi:hypothetical protein